MPKKAAQGRGKPRYEYVSVEKLAELADRLRLAWMNLADAAKEMRENGLDTLHLRAYQALGEHGQTVVEFASEAKNKVEPTLLARRMGRRTYSEEQQEKARRQTAKKAARSPTKRRPKKKPQE